jgi:hypothetical protein
MSGEINNNPLPVTPVFDLPESKSASTDKKDTIAPPEFNPGLSDSEKKTAETTLPGAKPETKESIKAAVGEIVSDLDKNNAWEQAANNFQASLLQQMKEDDEVALKDPVNLEWNAAAGAEIAQFALV